MKMAYETFSGYWLVSILSFRGIGIKGQYHELPLPSTVAASVPSTSSGDYDDIKEFWGLQSKASSLAPAQGQPQQEGALF